MGVVIPFPLRRITRGERRYRDCVAALVSVFGQSDGALERVKVADVVKAHGVTLCEARKALTAAGFDVSRRNRSSTASRGALGDGVMHWRFVDGRWVADFRAYAPEILAIAARVR